MRFDLVCARGARVRLFSWSHFAERLAEIDKAKANFLKHAEEAKAAAAEKERKQLAERERQREIAEHMERMRTEASVMRARNDLWIGGAHLSRRRAMQCAQQCWTR